MTIEIVIDGIPKTITRQTLFDLAAKGDIDPETPIIVDGKHATAEKIRGIIFDQTSITAKQNELNRMIDDGRIILNQSRQSTPKPPPVLQSIFSTENAEFAPPPQQADFEQDWQEELQRQKIEIPSPPPIPQTYQPVSPQVLEMVEEEYGQKAIVLDGVVILPVFIELLPEWYVRENSVLPYEKDGMTLQVFMSDPNNLEILDYLRFMLDCPIKARFATEESIQKVINQYYTEKREQEEESEKQLAEEAIRANKERLEEEEVAREREEEAREKEIAETNTPLNITLWKVKKRCKWIGVCLAIVGVGFCISGYCMQTYNANKEAVIAEFVARIEFLRTDIHNARNKKLDSIRQFDRTGKNLEEYILAGGVDWENNPDIMDEGRDALRKSIEADEGLAKSRQELERFNKELDEARQVFVSSAYPTLWINGALGFGGFSFLFGIALQVVGWVIHAVEPGLTAEELKNKSKAAWDNIFWIVFWVIVLCCRLACRGS